MIVNYPTTPTVSVKQAAKIMGIGKTLMYDMCAQGKIPTIRLGWRILIPTEALLARLGVGDKP